VTGWSSGERRADIENGCFVCGAVAVTADRVGKVDGYTLIDVRGDSGDRAIDRVSP